MLIGAREVGLQEPTYFIADIASNHDGSYGRAENLIQLAAEAGADAVKFQNFRADTIVSDYGFRELGPTSHQAAWKGDVYTIYKKYELPMEWTEGLRDAATCAGVDYLTTPYDLSIIDELNPHVDAWKIGSGDITYKPLINAISKSGKPIILSTGASTQEDIANALHWMWDEGVQELVLMHCNTNYTTENNFPYINLKVLVGWWGGGIIGFSDHTPGHSATLGAIALGARVIEKHFTDDIHREGPDHAFSMDPKEWTEMVVRARELEEALSGDGVKKVEANEKETKIMQRRAVRVIKDMQKGDVVCEKDLRCLRPCPTDALPPYRIDEALGLVLQRDLPLGDCIRLSDLQ